MSLLSPVRAGQTADELTDDDAWLQAMLAAEAALVRAQSVLGLVPPGAARTITDVAHARTIDVAELARAARAAANPVVAMVERLTAAVAAVDPAAAEYVHRGSTSQDVLDTAGMMVARRCLEETLVDLGRARDAAARLARAHRDTVMAARTLAVHAVPTTFGLKAAGWLVALTERVDRLSTVCDTLPMQLGGAAGTLAGYVEYADPDDRDRYARRLATEYAAQVGLREPVLPWHTARAPVVELSNGLAVTTGVLGKIAVDVKTLSRTEIGEVAEPAAEGRGQSSAMPQKRNPVLSALIISAAVQVIPLAAGLGHSMLAEDERDAGLWHAEWQPMRECLRLSGAAAATTAELLEGLEVHPERMRENLARTGGLIVSERLAVALTDIVGKLAGKKLVSRAALESARTGRPLAEIVAEAPEVAGRRTVAEIAALLEPSAYLGTAGDMVDRALRYAEHK
jgi:3-carboxy-cis,cis-muconate cycloisomerase